MLKQRRGWDEAELTILKDSGHLTAKQLTKLLPDRTDGAIKNKRVNLKLQVTPKGAVPWSSSEEEILIANRKISAEELAEKLNKPVSSVYYKRRELNVPRIHLCIICGKVTKDAEKYCSECRTPATNYKYYVARCKKLNRKLEVSQVEFVELVKLPCTYCGKPSTGLDRIDNKIGYLKSNVAPCCKRCNIMKNNMEVTEFLSHVKLIAKMCEE